MQETVDEGKTEHWRPVLVIALVGAILLTLVFWWDTANGLPRSLEYDEIWTLQKYAKSSGPAEVFADVSTPNNHTLNSLAIWALWPFVPDNALIVRLGAFLAGISSCLAAGLLARRWVGNATPYGWIAGATTMALCAANPWMMRYTQTARGYSYQAALLVITILGLWNTYETKSKAGRIRWGTLATLATSLAVIHMPTSMIFCGTAWIFFVAMLWRRHRTALFKGEALPEVIAGCATFAVTCVWLVVKWDQFMAGRDSLAEPIGLAASLLRWLTIWGSIAGWWLVVVAIVAVALARSRRLLLICAGLLFCAAVLVKMIGASFDRAYMPLIPVFCALLTAAVVMACQCRELSKRAMTAVALALSLLAPVAAYGLSSRIIPPDWPRVFEVAEQELEKNVYVAYPATFCLEILYANRNNPTFSSKVLSRYPTASGSIAIARNSEHLSGIYLLQSNRSKLIKLHQFGGGRERIVDGRPMRLYDYRPMLENDQATENFVAVCAIDPRYQWNDPEAAELFRQFDLGGWMLLNSFFRRNLMNTYNTKQMFGVFVRELDGPRVPHLLALQKRTEGQIRFFRIVADGNDSPPAE